MFAVEEKSYHYTGRSRGKVSLCEDESLSGVKEKRIALMEVLLTSAVFPGLKLIPKSGNWTVNVKVDKGQAVPDLMRLMANVNLNSGGPEVLELLHMVHAQPRSLKSTCRLVIRRRLSRPILLLGNVDGLPLPYHVKCFVAMDKMAAL